MHKPTCDPGMLSARRSFLKQGIAAGAAGIGVGFTLLDGPFALGQSEGPEETSGSLIKGDAALLRFAAAAEILESDFWVQYNELGGIQDSEVPGGSGNPLYTKKLQKLDADSLSTSMTTRTTRSLTSLSLTHTSSRKGQIRSISINSESCQAAQRLDRAKNRG